MTVFSQETVEFAVLEVTIDGVRPSRKFLDGTRAFPRPDTLFEARLIFSMINQVSYSFPISRSWTDSFIEVVKDGAKTLILIGGPATDWGKQGFGFFLTQHFCNFKKLHPKCCCVSWKLVLAGGRFTEPSESCYRIIGGEGRGRGRGRSLQRGVTIQE